MYSGFSHCKINFFSLPFSSLMQIVLLLGIGLMGAAGSLCRYGLSHLIGSAAFPFSTLAINLLGAFTMGLLMAAQHHHKLPPTILPWLGVGFLGGFTTFSTFSFELFSLLKQNQLGLAFTYALLSLFGGLCAVFCGWRIIH